MKLKTMHCFWIFLPIKIAEKFTVIFLSWQWCEQYKYVCNDRGAAIVWATQGYENGSG